MRFSILPSRRVLHLSGGMAAVAAVLVTGPAATQTAASGPVARYEMRAGTMSGMAGMGGGMGGAMAMMFGGGGGAQHELQLRLGSTQTPAKGKPKADHFMPSGAKLGKSVALITPAADPESVPEEFQRPKGRLLIYWGCGEKAPKGQPVIIDFARLAAGQMPPDLYSRTILRDYGPTMANSRTYGHWPSKDGKYAKPDSSLLGAHRIAGNYSPEIAFNLSQDFMAPLALQTSDTGGSVPMSWGGIPAATGYYAWAFGGKMDGSDQPKDMVWWSSSAAREFGGGLTDWLSPANVARLVQQKVVMPPATTRCTIPAEVRRAAPDFLMASLYAYGPEENFSFPPKPADAKTPWHLQWTTRVRHRSMASVMIGMPGMDGMQGAEAEPAEKKCKPSLGGMLGGMLGGKGC